MTDLGPCYVDGCPNRGDRLTPHGPLCSTHRKRLLPSRAGGKALLEPVEVHRPVSEQVKEVALAYAEADDDVEYAKAERDLEQLAAALAEERRTRDRVKRALERYGKEVIAQRISARTKEAMAALQADGVHVGRPREVDPELARQALRVAGSIRKAAAELGVARQSLRDALGKKGVAPFRHVGTDEGDDSDGPRPGAVSEPEGET